MKILVNSDNYDLINTFIKTTNNSALEFIISNVEKDFFDKIEKCDIDAYIITTHSAYHKKAIDFIKKNQPYVPIVVLIDRELNNYSNLSADILMPLNVNLSATSNIIYDMYVQSILTNILKYVKTFSTLKKLTAKMPDKIIFGDCMYDPTRRLLFYNDKEVKRLSTKEGGILELLASNYGSVVKKEIILEKVWRNTDYFSSRSMDVYITYIRNIFKKYNIKMSIKNVSGIGLLME